MLFISSGAALLTYGSPDVVEVLLLGGPADMGIGQE